MINDRQIKDGSITIMDLAYFSMNVIQHNENNQPTLISGAQIDGNQNKYVLTEIQWGLLFYQIIVFLQPLAL